MKPVNTIKAVLLSASLALFSGSALALQGGFPVPNFELPTLANAPAGATKLKLNDFRGKVVYVDFWASWCVPCRASLPALNELRNTYGAKGFEVIAINMDEDEADAKKFLKSFPVGYPIVKDPSGLVAEGYELKGMPHAAVIDKAGNLRQIHEGWKKEDKEKLEKLIAQMLQE